MLIDLLTIITISHTRRMRIGMHMIALAIKVAHVLLAIRLVAHDMRPTHVINGKAVAGTATAIGILGGAVDVAVAQGCGSRRCGGGASGWGGAGARGAAARVGSKIRSIRVITYQCRDTCPSTAIEKWLVEVWTTVSTNWRWDWGCTSGASPVIRDKSSPSSVIASSWG